MSVDEALYLMMGLLEHSVWIAGPVSEPPCRRRLYRRPANGYPNQRDEHRLRGEGRCVMLVFLLAGSALVSKTIHKTHFSNIAKVAVIPSQFVEAATVIALVFCRIAGFLVVSPFRRLFGQGSRSAHLPVAMHRHVLAGPRRFDAARPQPRAHRRHRLCDWPADWSGVSLRDVFNEFMAGMVSQASWRPLPSQ